MALSLEFLEIICSPFTFAPDASKQSFFILEHVILEKETFPKSMSMRLQEFVHMHLTTDEEG